MTDTKMLESLVLDLIQQDTLPAKAYDYFAKWSQKVQSLAQNHQPLATDIYLSKCKKLTLRDLLEWIIEEGLQ